MLHCKQPCQLIFNSFGETKSGTKYNWVLYLINLFNILLSNCLIFLIQICVWQHEANTDFFSSASTIVFKNSFICFTIYDALSYCSIMPVAVRELLAIYLFGMLKCTCALIFRICKRMTKGKKEREYKELYSIDRFCGLLLRIWY